MSRGNSFWTNEVTGDIEERPLRAINKTAVVKVLEEVRV